MKKSLFLYTLLSILVISDCKDYSITVIGKTGVGKSSLVNTLFSINTLFGKMVADIGYDEIITTEVSKYTKIIKKDKIHIWDTIGFYDEYNKPKEYIEKIVENVKETHLILFCFDLTEPRWTKDNKELIDLVKNKLDQKIFENTIFVFTKYNVYRNMESYKKRKYKILSIIPKARFALAENNESFEWKQTFWKTIIETTKKQMKPIMLKIMYERTNVCEICRNVTKNIKEHGVLPNYMNSEMKKKYNNCLINIEEYNNRFNTLSHIFAMTIYINLGPVIKMSKLLAGGVSLGSGMYMKGFLSKFHKNISYCETEKKIPNINNYNDIYEWTNGKYIGQFKRNLFHGEGEILNEKNNTLYKGLFINGMPKICLNN